MRKRLITLLITACLILPYTKAQAIEAPDIRLMNCTAYTGGTVTATGKKPREGLAAGDLEHLGDGWCAVIYQAIPNGAGGYKIGKQLWILEIEDTAGLNSEVREGRTIDVYRDNLERCQEVMDKVYENGAKGKVFVQYIQAQG